MLDMVSNTQSHVYITANMLCSKHMWLLNMTQIWSVHCCFKSCYVRQVVNVKYSKCYFALIQKEKKWSGHTRLHIQIYYNQMF